MQIYIVSISILLLNPNRSTVAHWSHLSSSNLGDFIRGVRLHRNGLNVTEIEIEIEVHKSFTCCSTSLRFVMKRYVADMSCTLLTINQLREREEEAWEIVDRQEYATAVRVIHLDYLTSSTSRARCNDAHESCLNLNSKYQLGT